MMDPWEQIGLGGALLITLQIIREVITTLLKKGKNGSAGEKSPEYWEIRMREIMDRIIEDKMDGHFESMEKSLKEIRDSLVTLMRWKR